MTEPVYHADLFIPEQVYMEAAFALCHTGGAYTLHPHAAQRVRTKHISLPERIPIHLCKIVEVTGNPMRKYLIRFPFGGQDVVMSLTKEGLVITVYANASGDHHATLDPSKYELAPR